MKDMTFDFSLASGIAQQIVDLLVPGCLRIDIAGSLRRGCKIVHDIDIVCFPIMSDVRSNQPDLFSQSESVGIVKLPIALNAITDYNGFGRIIKDKNMYARVFSFNTPKILMQEYSFLIPIEVYVAEPDGKNYEALLQMRTGNANFNICMASRARQLGLTYKAGHGIYNGNERVDDGTEAGIFNILGLEYIYPKDRIGGQRYLIKS